MLGRILHCKRMLGLRLGYLRCYLEKYGIARAFSAWRELHVRGHFDTAFIRAPWGGTSPIWLRPGSPDIGTFEHVFVWEGYRIELPFVPQTILDLGGNVGLASVWFAEQYPEARIVAVEPDPENFGVLLKNSESRESIFGIHAAVGARDGMSKCENPSALSHSFRFVEADSDGNIRVLSVKSIMAMAKAMLPDLVKIDIEGAEQALFADDSSLGEWLPHTRAIAVEIHSAAARSTIEQALPVAEWQHRQCGETDFFVRRGALIWTGL
jgi:FkbM family methyltransferase